MHVDLYCRGLRLTCQSQLNVYNTCIVGIIYLSPVNDQGRPYNSSVCLLSMAVIFHNANHLC